MQVGLFKKKGTYKDKEGKEKYFINFYVQCGSKMVPVEVKYFPNAQFDGRDPAFSGRKELMDAFAEEFPEKEKQ